MRKHFKFEKKHYGFSLLDFVIKSINKTSFMQKITLYKISPTFLFVIWQDIKKENCLCNHMKKTKKRVNGWNERLNSTRFNNVVIKGSVNVYFIKWFQWWNIYNVFLKQIHVLFYVINSSFYGANQNSVLFWQASENILFHININFATICYKNAMTA